MEYHEKLALIAYGLTNNVDTTNWTIEAVPAEHLEAFKTYVRECRLSAIERLNEPDDPGDQAWWHERVLEWDDILRTLYKEGSNAIHGG